MPKHHVSLPAAPVQQPWAEWPLPLAYDDFEERFYALLDDDGLKEVFREFLVLVRRDG